MIGRDTRTAAPARAEVPAFDVARDLDLEPVLPAPPDRTRPDEDPSAWRDSVRFVKRSELSAAQPGGPAFSAGGPAVRIVEPADLDLPASGVLSGARVTLGGVRDAGAERLHYDLSGSRILARRDGDASGDRIVLVFERADTAANYSQVLGSIRYLNRADDASEGTRTAIFEAFDETGRAKVAAVTSVEVAHPRERLGLEAADDTRLALENIGEAAEFASRTAAERRVAVNPLRKPLPVRASDAAAGGVVETEAYSLVLDTGASMFVDRLAAARHAAGLPETGEDHVVYGDGAGTRLSFAPRGAYRVFVGETSETAAPSGIKEPTPANENAAFAEFGIDGRRPFDDAGSSPVHGPVPSGRTPAFDNLPNSPLAGQADVVDTGSRTLTA